MPMCCSSFPGSEWPANARSTTTSPLWACPMPSPPEVFSEDADRKLASEREAEIRDLETRSSNSRSSGTSFGAGWKTEIKYGLVILRIVFYQKSALANDIHTD